MTRWPVELTTDGKVSCGVVLWRFQHRLRMTVVVKATFSLAHDVAVTPVAPAEILREDRTFDRHPTRSVEAASDLAPYLARCDVTFTGHAHAPAGRPAPASAARLAIFRDARALLDKTLHVVGDRAAAGGAPQPFTRIPLVYERALGGPGVDLNPVGSEAPNLVDPADPRRPAGLGPLSRYWPARKRLLGAVDRKSLEGAIAELPDPTPWAYYQAAPADQQIEYLQGAEWIVLDGLHPTLPRLQTRLMGARGLARIHVGAVETPVDLVADTLAIDGERLQCSIVWRGNHEITGGEAALSTMVVAAALELPGGAVTWPRPASDGAGTPWGRAPIAPAPLPVGEGTFVVPEGAAGGGAPEATIALRSGEGASASRPATPFAPAPARPESPPSAPSTAATPWSPIPLAAVLVAAPGETTLGSRGIGLPMGAPAPSAPPPIAAPDPEADWQPILEPADEPEDPRAMADVLREAGATPEEIASLVPELGLARPGGAT